MNGSTAGRMHGAGLNFWKISKEMPDLIGFQEVKENSSCPRVCNVVRLRHKESGRIFHLFNTHLEHLHPEARLLQLESLLTHMKEL